MWIFLLSEFIASIIRENKMHTELCSAKVKLLFAKNLRLFIVDLITWVPFCVDIPQILCKWIEKGNALWLFLPNLCVMFIGIQF